MSDMVQVIFQVRSIHIWCTIQKKKKKIKTTALIFFFFFSVHKIIIVVNYYQITFQLSNCSFIFSIIIYNNLIRFQMSASTIYVTKLVLMMVAIIEFKLAQKYLVYLFKNMKYVKLMQLGKIKSSSNKTLKQANFSHDCGLTLTRARL